MKDGKSRMPGFYKLSPPERLERIAGHAGLTAGEKEALRGVGLGLEGAEHMIENVIGTYEVPVGIAANFVINGVDRLIPMATEEASVVAAASKAARIARSCGGFTASVSKPVMIGQIQICNMQNASGAKKSLLEAKEIILSRANEQDPILVKYGGGAKDVEVRIVDTPEGEMLLLHLLVDCRDAMGANAVNTMAEAVAPLVEELSGGRAYLKIISNLALHRTAKASAIFPKSEIGEDAIDAIIKAYELAAADPFRCATHNKGIMNGVSAVTLATGNDTRAVEAGAHAYAAYQGGYRPLTQYHVNESGDLEGSIEIPVPVGIIGGATAVHPVARACLKILDIKSAAGLGEILASVGLAQNFAALLALSTEGIQRGHMKLHARNLAVTAGAPPHLVEEVTAELIKEERIGLDRAKEILAGLTEKKD